MDACEQCGRLDTMVVFLLTCVLIMAMEGFCFWIMKQISLSFIILWVMALCLGIRLGMKNCSKIRNQSLSEIFQSHIFLTQPLLRQKILTAFFERKEKDYLALLNCLYTTNHNNHSMAITLNVLSILLLLDLS